MFQELVEYLERLSPQPPATPAEVYQHYEQGLSAKYGYWGQVDSGVDWCELNYAISPYIAEFFNTLSSIPMILWSFAGAYFTYKYASKEVSFQCCFFSGALVGIGSAMFHGSLRFSAQLFDEIPMLIHEVTMLYVVSNIHRNPNIKNNEINYVLMFILMLMLIIVTFLYVWTGQWYIFLLVYGSVVLLVIGICLSFVVRSTLLMKIFLIAMVVYFVSWLLWLMDLYYCQLYLPYQLHSLWHLGAGYGSYLCMLVILLERLQYLSQFNSRITKKNILEMNHPPIYELKMSKLLIPYATVNHFNHQDNHVDIHID